MVERVALTVSLIALLVAFVGVILRVDRALFVVSAQFSLRTLLILLAVLPPTCAGGYWSWNAFRPKPSTWFIQDGLSPPYIPPPGLKRSRELALKKRIEADATVDRSPRTSFRP